jgi:hypothetical protein
LLVDGADIDKLAFDVMTPLMRATYRGHAQLVSPSWLEMRKAHVE